MPRLNVAIRYRPDMFANVFYKRLAEDIFPCRWKRQKLVLISKPGKPPSEPSSNLPTRHDGENTGEDN